MINQTIELIKKIQDVFEVPREDLIVKTSDKKCIETLKTRG